MKHLFRCKHGFPQGCGCSYYWRDSILIGLSEWYSWRHHSSDAEEKWNISFLPHYSILPAIFLLSCSVVNFPTYLQFGASSPSAWWFSHHTVQLLRCIFLFHLGGVFPVCKYCSLPAVYFPLRRRRGESGKRGSTHCTNSWKIRLVFPHQYRYWAVERKMYVLV